MTKPLRVTEFAEEVGVHPETFRLEGGRFTHEIGVSLSRALSRLEIR